MQKKEIIIINLQKFINKRIEKANISCRSFLVTLFGDVISQHGDWVSLASLINVMQYYGFNERSVRTAVFRLTKEDWLIAKKIGRRSYYSYTENARRQFLKAEQRIYSQSIYSCGDQWLIVFPSFVEDKKLVLFKRQLKWLGFSSLTSGAYAHPQCAQETLEETICELGLTDSVITFCAKTLDKNATQVLKNLVLEKWQLEDLAQRYEKFIQIYQPLMDTIKEILQKADCDRDAESRTIHLQHLFQFRVLLIHEYRRILLKDHQLAPSMLPTDWPAKQAVDLVIEIYQALMPSSCLFICQNLSNAEGHLPAAKAAFYRRYQR
ncbi:MAG: PaaX family transcriptional regulator C-terminal domain-containing protein [Enterobacterales bacterium]|nr:PaaX family transcriptional regulator C-terminal domain-containing protein [Enterobacterales bacterium]